MLIKVASAIFSSASVTKSVVILAPGRMHKEGNIAENVFALLPSKLHLSLIRLLNLTE